MRTGTIAFLLGVCLLQWHGALPPLWWWALPLPPLLLLWRYRPRAALLTAALLGGYLWAGWYAHHILDAGLDPALEGEELLLTGTVESLPRREGKQLRFLFRPDTLSLDATPYPPPPLIRLSWYDEAATLAYGERWQLQVRLKRPWGMRNPGGFDYEGWLFQQGIRATGYVRDSALNQRLGESGGGPFQRLRQRLDEAMAEALRGNEFGGIITALAIGERGGISEEQWGLLRVTGTNHLMAISGLHIGLVAGFGFFLLRRLWGRCQRCTLCLAAPRAAALGAFLLGLLYAALAGFSLPTQRALLMLAMLMGAVWWQRALQPSRVLAIALLLVLLHDPLAVLSAGFWLSFGAVALILFGMGGRLHPRGWWWRWGHVQWLLAVGLAPLLLLIFGQASLSAPLANLLAVPWVGMTVVPLTLLGTLLLLPWPDGGAWLLQLAARLVEWLWPLLSWLERQVPPLSQPDAPLWTLPLALLGVLWLLAPRGWPLRLAGVLPLLPLLLWHPEPLAEGVARFTLLDVGQGLAAVVETRNHLLVFDTGARFPSGFDSGEAVVLPFLARQGRGRIDTLVVSHGDNDHIGGARSLAAALPIGRVLTSVPQKMGWIGHERCRRGEQWQWDGVTFEMLHPSQAPAAAGRGNNDSCVLRVSAGGEALLLTGDIEAEAEQELLALGPEALASTVLVAPHHGSNSSSSAPFLRAVSPRWVLFALGYRNRYGFPHPAVVARYREQGVGMLDSADSGAIALLLGAGEPQPHSYRRQSLRYWHSR